MRRDIQFLRGIAVLIVVLYHAGMTGIANGFLGVDIFFVISGFLITSIILRDLDAGTFSFNRFYLRRAKRLLPAIYCTLIVSTVCAHFFLTTLQWNDYTAQLMGALTFTANMILPTQVGYFQGAAEAKPLLHIWSLSLEEQYYLLLPFLLFLCRPAARAPVIVLGLAVSLALCLYSVSYPFGRWGAAGTTSADWAFYLFPTRAWELLVGSLAAWAMLRFPDLRIAPWLKFSALLTIAVVICYPLDSVHPRGDALVVVLATAILILGRDDWLPALAPIKAVERVGDWSYSLYLVHWPLLAFAHNAYLGNVPRPVEIMMVPAAILLAYLQYRYVEETFRRGWQQAVGTTWRWLGAATLSIFVLMIPGIYGSETALDFPEVRRINYGLSASCRDLPSSLVPRAECVTGKKPVVAVWGDSYAMHLVPGLVAHKDIGGNLIQITRSACAPILGLARFNAKYNRRWGANCLEFNKRAFQLIEQSDSIKVVFMSASFGPYMTNKGEILSGDKVVARNTALFVRHLTGTINALIGAGKTPVLVSPAPAAGFDIGDCLEREANGLVNLARDHCRLTRAEYDSFYKMLMDALRDVEKKTQVATIWLDKLLCADSFCETRRDGVYLYRDGSHLSISGSKYLIGNLDLSRVFSSSPRQ